MKDVERCYLVCSMNPYADFAYDGLLLNPLEVVFVKVKRFQQEANWGSTRLAAAYSRWMDQEVGCLSSMLSCHLPCVPGAASALLRYAGQLLRS